jgi:hypothetical protein
MGRSLAKEQQKVEALKALKEIKGVFGARKL